MFLTLALLLPFVTGQIEYFGNMLCPMHLPVMLCGIICGPLYGAVIGFIAPLMRNVLFLMPKFPTAIAMSFELMVYGLVCGVLICVLNKKFYQIYVVLIASMLCGRLVWGLVAAFIYPLLGVDFTLPIFISGAFLEAWPGMILQLVLIPVILIALKKAKLIKVFEYDKIS